MKFSHQWIPFQYRKRNKYQINVLQRATKIQWVENHCHTGGSFAYISFLSSIKAAFIKNLLNVVMVQVQVFKSLACYTVVIMYKCVLNKIPISNIKYQWEISKGDSTRTFGPPPTSAMKPNSMAPEHWPMSWDAESNPTPALTNYDHHNMKSWFFKDSFTIYKVLLVVSASWVMCLYGVNQPCNMTDSHLILRPNVSITWSESWLAACSISALAAMDCPHHGA